MIIWVATERCRGEHRKLNVFADVSRKQNKKNHVLAELFAHVGFWCGRESRRNPVKSPSRITAAIRLPSTTRPARRRPKKEPWFWDISTHLLRHSATPVDSQPLLFASQLISPAKQKNPES